MMTAEVVLCIALAAALFAALAFGVGVYVLRDQRAWRREDAKWKAHYGNRWAALEQRLMGSMIDAPVQLQPAFTARDSAQSGERESPDYGEPTAEIERATWTPPTSRRKG